MSQTQDRIYAETVVPDESPTDAGFDRRALLRRAAVAGAVSWTAPVILSSSIASAGVFTAKCAPGTTTSSATFVQNACGNASTTITITIVFAGPCPCGGASAWCAQKNSPSPTVASATSTLVFSVTIPISTTVSISGKVAHGCTDRDGDRQYATYDWAMTARDSGQACGVANSISAATLTNRTTVISASCPSLTALVAPATIVVPASSAIRPLI